MRLATCLAPSDPGSASRSDADGPRSSPFRTAASLHPFRAEVRKVPSRASGSVPVFLNSVGMGFEDVERVNMTHIKTTSEEETKMRSAHPVVKCADAVLAGPEELAIARDIAKLSQQSDECLLNISKLKAKLMEKMGDHAELRDENGTLVASWLAGGVQSKVDYELMIREYGVTQDWISRHTKVVQKARTFKIED